MAARSNYQIRVTLKDALPEDVGAMIDVLLEEYDLSVDEYTVEAYEQLPDESWNAIDPRVT